MEWVNSGTFSSCFKRSCSDIEMCINNNALNRNDGDDGLPQDVIEARQLTKRDRALQKLPIVHIFVRAKKLRRLGSLIEKQPYLMDSNDWSGRKPLSLAAYKGYSEGVSYLLMKFPQYAKVRDEDGSFPIHKAVMKGHVEVVAELLSRCPETMHQTNSKRQTILHIAALNDQAGVLNYLMKEHAENLKEIFHSRDDNDDTFQRLLDLRKERGCHGF